MDGAAQKVACIEWVIASQKPYLDSQINLERFSACCALKPREVSVLLNRHYKKNFFEFINELRVEEVKKQLLENEARPILEIAMAAGFNSHSAFQRFFKRFVGVSPSQYRREAGTRSISL
jgi:AraC-like DNA-binding protein